MKLNLLLRGHVRNSFNNDAFYLLIKQVTQDFETDIYIHTWNVVQSSLSWRGMHNDNTEVNEEFLKNYFKDLWPNVKHVIIEDDTKINLHGNTEGNVGLTPCPVRAYKNMFYGKRKLAEYVYNNVPHQEIAVQTRFDILTNSFSTRPEAIINFLHNPPQTDDRVKFISLDPILGIENIYMSTVENMYKFINYFYINFDEIYKKHNQTRHQEHPVFFERNSF
jgi:hypothetical protein